VALPGFRGRAAAYAPSFLSSSRSVIARRRMPAASESRLVARTPLVFGTT